MGWLGRRLARLEGVSRALAERQVAWDLARLDDDELAELAVLTRHAEEANRVGATLGWSADEEAALIRLGATAYRDGGVPAKETT
jgi:hypothetical protein